MTVERQILLETAGTESAPALVFHANPTYAQYHWLRALGSGDSSAIPEGVRDAVSLVNLALDPLGPRGLQAPWEQALANATGPEQARQRYGDAVTATGQLVSRALEVSADHFRLHVWPDHLERIRESARWLEGDFAKAWPRIASRQSDVLGVCWPSVVEVSPVATMAGREGAYSHPLTIDVCRLDRSGFMETVIHEATHVADVHTLSSHRQPLGSRLQPAIAHVSWPRGTWQVWHAIIFAASAHRVREALDAGHVDYATGKGLYAWFGVPDMVEIWSRFEADRDEAALVSAICSQARDHENGVG